MSDAYSRIFLLSHMRAFTSLAGHVLGSHPDINGYFELHLSYADDAALQTQLALLEQEQGLKPGSRYLFDKLLHNDYPLVPGLPGLADARVLVSLRQPEQSIRSIVNLFAGKAVAEPYASPVEAVGYYIDRVNALAAFGADAGQPYRYFDAELWQEAPEQLLTVLSNWLRLEMPLSDEYATFSRTGEARSGDSSSRIHSGRISQDRSDYSRIEVPEAMMREARDAYQRARGVLVAHAAAALTR